MKGKKIFQFGLIAAMLLQTAVIPCRAEDGKAWDWGNYPEHTTVRRQLSKANDVYTYPAHKDSPAENLFTIGGRRFIMLDKNDDGDYFVMADEEYGQARPFSTTLASSDRVQLLDVMAYEWRFDPEVPGNVGYVLNNENGILSGNPENALPWQTGQYTGTTEARVIPAEMADDILEHDWPIEPFYVQNNIKLGEKGYVDFEAWENKQYMEEKNGYTTVRAKLALPSYTEVMTYKEKIGYKNYLSTHMYAGTMCRTATASASYDNALKIVGGLFCIRLQDATSKVTLPQVANFTEPALYMVRPVMWLKSGFFANNKIDVESAGETVLTEMRTAYTAADYLDKYSVDEINSIYGIAADAPEISNPYTAGTPAVGGALQAEYNYSSLLGEEEGDTEVYWLSSNSADGKFTYTGVRSKQFKLTDEYAGKYIKCAIVPKDASGRRGRLYLSEPTAAVVRSASGILVSDISYNKGALDIELKNLLGSEKSATAVYAEYNADGSISGDPEKQEIKIAAGGTEKYSKQLNGESSVTILNESGYPIFSKSTYKPQNDNIKYQPYKVDISPDTGEIVITGKSEKALFNRMITAEITPTLSGTEKMYYFGTAQTNSNGEYIFRFYMPSGTKSETFTLKRSAFGDISSETMYWTDPDDVVKILEAINQASSADEIGKILNENIQVLLSSDTWWKIITNEAKAGISEEVLKNRPYTALEAVKAIVHEKTALEAFGRCTTGEQIENVLADFSDVYAIDENSSICFELYKNFSDSDKKYAYSAMAAETSTPTKEGVINTFDRATLVTAISKADQPIKIQTYLDTLKYRNLITGFNNYSSYDPQVLARHLYSYGDIKTIGELKTAIGKCPKKTIGGGADAPSGGNSGSSGGSGSGGGVRNWQPSVVEPVNNETVVYFNDLEEFEWARPAIESLAKKELINGVDEKIFAPGANVTREQFVKMLIDALEIPQGTNNVSFDDLDENHWAYKAVCAACENEIVNGITEQSFGTGQDITRQDMAVMAYRALIKKGYNKFGETKTDFTDAADIADYAVQSVSDMSGSKIINGYTDGSFRPKNTATRAEAAQIIYNIISSLENN